MRFREPAFSILTLRTAGSLHPYFAAVGASHLRSSASLRSYGGQALHYTATKHRTTADVALNRSQAAPHRLPSAACSLFRAMARRFPPAALALTRLAPGSRLRATGGYTQYQPAKTSLAG